MVKGNQPLDHYHSRAGLSAGLRVTWVGFAVNVLLIVLKLWVGIISRSQALVADGVHSISDLFSDAVVILGLKWGRKEADEDHHYGHARIETSASLIVGLLLLIVAGWIAISAILAIYHHQDVSPTLVTVAVALFAVMAKEALYWYTIAVGRRIRSQALIGNAWHHRSDALSSIAVLIGVVAAYLNPDWHLADSVAALIVSVFILRVSYKLMKSAFREMIDTAPDAEVTADVTRIALNAPGVRDVHDLKARYSGPQILVELHIVVKPDLTVREGHAIAKKVEHSLLDRVGDLVSVTIHVDPDAAGQE